MSVPALELDLGAMTTQLQWVAPVLSDDGRGGQQETGVVALSPAYAWVQLEPLSSREVLQVGQQKGAITHRCRMYHHPGVTLRTRALLGSRTFEVISILERGAGSRAVELLLAERTAATGGAS